MDDLISREALIELVMLQQQDALDGATVTGKTMFKQKAIDCKNFIKLIESAPAVEAVPVGRGWIPCNERLPETGAEVLVTLECTYAPDYTTYSIARHIKFEDGENHWCDNRYGYLEWDKYSDGRGGNSSYRVIAWMPLPKLYKEQT